MRVVVAMAGTPRSTRIIAAGQTRVCGVATVVRMGRYEALGRRGQIRRLGALGRTALRAYGVDPGRIRVLRHEHNTTFRVDAPGGPFVLRINRPNVQTTETISSEMAWLDALGRDTDLGIPIPVQARDGSLVVVETDPGVPGPRACVLLRWLDGRFLDRTLAPVHLRQVARLLARLHAHAETWQPATPLVRPRIDT